MFESVLRWLPQILTLLGIVVGAYIALYSINKQTRLQVNRERLHIVYFPLMKVLNFNAWDENAPLRLYFFLMNKMDDEKYRTLVQSNSILTYFDDLRFAFSTDHVYSNREARKAYARIFHSVNDEFKSVEQKTGYEPRTYTIAFYFLVIFYVFLLSASFLKNHNSEELPPLGKISMLAALVCFFISAINYLYAFIQEVPIYWRKFKRWYKLREHKYNAVIGKNERINK